LPVSYRIFPDIPFDQSKTIIREAAALLPEGVETLDQKGWNGFLEHYLGEGQFGPERYNLSSSKRSYYQLKPLLPRSAVRLLRKGYRQFQEDGFPLNWPIEDRFVKFLNTVYKANSKLAINNGQLSMIRDLQSDICPLISEKAPLRSALCPLPSVPLILPILTSDLLNFWPSGKQFAFVITHDVETEKGLGHVRELARADAEHGFRSCFNFVPERYPVEPKLRRDLEDQGFEIGVHGLKHDGKLRTLSSSMCSINPEHTPGFRPGSRMG